MNSPSYFTTLRLTLANGHSWETQVNHEQTCLSDWLRYFLGQEFDCEPYPSERKSRCVKLEVNGISYC